MEGLRFIGLDFETLLVKRSHKFYSFQVYSEDYPNTTGVFYDPTDLYRFFSKKYDRAVFAVFNLHFDGILISKILNDYPVNGPFHPIGYSDYKVSALYSRGHLKSMRIERGKYKWRVYDLQNVFRVRTLAKLAESIGLKKLERPAFLGQRPPENEEEKRAFEDYALNDAKIVYYAIKKVYDEFKTIRSTAGGLSIRVFKRDYWGRFNFVRLDPESEKFVRSAYKGGRTECFIRGCIPDKVYHYDVNSMYPFVMMHNRFPNVLFSPREKLSVNLDWEGVAEALVYVDDDIPPLGVRLLHPDGFKRLTFPQGRFWGFFTYPELRYIEEKKIGKILAIRKALEWNSTFSPFYKFVKDFYKKKEKAENEGSVERTLYKLVLNSLYGKFGEWGELEKVILKGEMIVGKEKVDTRKKWYHNPVLSAYITAYARLYLHEIMEKVGEKSLVYCDTDSVFSLRPLPSLEGRELGMLKLKGEAREGLSWFFRSKFYVFEKDIIVKGFNMKMKVPQFLSLIFMNQTKVLQTKILKLIEASKRGLRPLLQVGVEKMFSVTEDFKRKYHKYLDHKRILFEHTYSDPIVLKGGF